MKKKYRLLYRYTDAATAGGNIIIQGSKVDAGKNVTLKADDDILLLASKDTESNRSTNKSASTSAGVAITAGANGFGMGVTASAARGAANSDSTTYNNTSIKAGNLVDINSGGDTTLKGANVNGQQVIANIGTNPEAVAQGKGNLTIESLQDAATYQSKQKSTSASVTLSPTGVPTGGSATASKTNVNSNYQSVGTQSGIATGIKDPDGKLVDGGFQINVAGNTTLTGGKITSTDTVANAKDGNSKDTNGNPVNLNSFATGTGANGGLLSTTDLQNQAAYKASSASLTVGTGGGGGGVGSKSGSAQSTTQSGITGVATDSSGKAMNANIKTGDAETGIKPIFTKDTIEKVTKDVQAQVAITQQFGMQASKTIGDEMGKKEADLKKQAKAAADLGTPEGKAKADELNAEAQKWGEGGTYRVLAHTVIGGLTGDLKGALGAASSQTAIPLIGEQIAKLDIPVEAKKLLIQAAGIAIGAATGDVSGAVTAQNATANNYLKHVEINKLISSRKECDGGDTNACKEVRQLEKLDKQRQQDLAACTGNTSSACQGKIQDAAEAFDGLAIYRNVLIDKVKNGEVSPQQIKPYLDTATREMKDVATHLKDFFYLRANGNLKSSDYEAAKMLEGLNSDISAAFGVTPALGNRVAPKITTDKNGVPDFVTRSDNNFASTVNEKGQPKAYIDANGNLVPANIDGTGDIKSHVRGGNSQNTAMISTTDPTQALNPLTYGSNTKPIDTTALQDGIVAGKVQNVEIITPAQVRENLQTRIDEKQTAYDKNPTKANRDSLDRAKEDLSNATRDGECLIKGCVPSQYIRPVYPQGTPPIRPPLIIPQIGSPIQSQGSK